VPSTKANIKPDIKDVFLFGGAGEGGGFWEKPTEKQLGSYPEPRNLIEAAKTIQQE